jgi:hypothetical protein
LEEALNLSEDRLLKEMNEPQLEGEKKKKRMEFLMASYTLLIVRFPLRILCQPAQNAYS